MNNNSNFNANTLEGVGGLAFSLGGMALQSYGNQLTQQNLKASSQRANAQTQQQLGLVDYNKNLAKINASDQALAMGSRQQSEIPSLGDVNANSGSLLAIAHKNYVAALDQQNTIEANANVQKINALVQDQQRQTEIGEDAAAQAQHAQNDTIKGIAGLATSVATVALPFLL